MAKKSLTSERLDFKDVRLSFPRLWTPKAFQEGQEPRFEATFLFDPSNEAHKASIAAIKAAGKKLAEAMWGDVPEDLKLAYGFADNNPTKKKYEGYPGMFYLATAKSSKKGETPIPPTIIGRNKTNGVWVQLKQTDAEAPFGGCYVNTNVTLWTQDNTFGKGIRANLRIVQFNRKGPAFSGAAPVNPDDEIEALGDASGGAKKTDNSDFD